MKFTFSLEPVLKVRKHEEKIQKQKLAEKLSEKKSLKTQKKRLQKKLEEHLDGSDSNGFVSVHNLRRYRGYIQEMHKKMERINGSLELAEKAVSQERDKLAAIHKKRNIIEKMKEEEHELFLEKISKEERKIMDEVATQTHNQ
jgi:flagellar export protein FliJ